MLVVITAMVIVLSLIERRADKYHEQEVQAKKSKNLSVDFVKMNKAMIDRS